MRMWGVSPSKMCRKHLLGEHVEMHMFVGTLLKEKSIQGYIDNQLVVVENIRKRHEELVKEMNRRGMNHKSPLPAFNSFSAGYIDIKLNEQELHHRCKDCKF